MFVKLLFYISKELHVNYNSNKTINNVKSGGEITIFLIYFYTIYKMNQQFFSKWLWRGKYFQA